MKLLSKINFNHPILAIASAIILALSYNFPRYTWPVMCVGLIPLLSFIENKSFSAKKIFLLGYLFGATYIAGTTIWILQSFPLDWANISSPITSSLLVILSWLIIALTLGIFIGLWTFTSRKLKHESLIINALLIASLWILFEYLRTIFFSIIWAGSESIIGAHFPIGITGNALAWSPFLPLASFGGTFALSFFIVMINIFLFSVMQNFKINRIQSQIKHIVFQPSFRITVIAILLVSSFAWHLILSQKNNPLSQKNQEEISIALIHTNFAERTSEDPHFEEAKFATLNKLLSQIKNGAKHPDVLIFPEDARFLISIAPESRHLLFSDALGSEEKTIIDSVHAISKGRVVPTAYFYNTKTDILTTSEKQILIPNGEYLPWIMIIPLKIANMENVIENFLRMRGFEKGVRPILAEHDSLNVGTIICSEIFSSSLLRNEPFNRSDIIVNLSSHAIFHGSVPLRNQTTALAKIRAAEIRRPIIIAGNMTPSMAIDARGNIITFNDSTAPSVSSISLLPSNERAFYAKYGDWVLIFSGIFIFLRVLHLFLTIIKRYLANTDKV